MRDLLPFGFGGDVLGGVTPAAFASGAACGALNVGDQYRHCQNSCKAPTLNEDPVERLCGTKLAALDRAIWADV